MNRRYSHRLLALALLGTGFLAGLAQSSQTPADLLLEETASYRAYLERNPFHERVFGDLCERAAEHGGLGPLVDHFRGRLELDSGDAVARVLVTRLLMMQTDYEAALTASAGLETAGVEGMLLVGDLKLRAGDVEPAATILEAALEAAESKDERGLVLRRLCGVWGGIGDAAGLARSAAALGELDPADYGLQREAAELLLDGGLLPEAAQAYGRALDLVPDDVPRRTQTLADMGACHERLFEGDRALECYSDALEMLHSEHWLGLDLAKRRLSLHRTAGTLEALATQLRAEAEDPQAGAGPWMQLAELELARNRPDAALEALLAGRELEPANGRVSDLLVASAETAGRIDVQQSELERRVAAQPRDLGLKLRLVRSLARGDKSAEARALLETLTRQEAGKPEWASPLARTWMEIGDGAAGLDVLDQAIAAGAGSGLVLERAQLAAEQGDVEGALAGLAAAQPSGRDDLMAFAGLHAELGDAAGARRCLEQAIEEDPEDTDPYAALADLLVEEGDIDGARTAVRAAVNVAPQRELDALLNRLARLLRADEDRAGWCDRERALLEAAPEDPLPLLVLATLQKRGSAGLALESYASYVEAVPNDQDALRAWARLLTTEQQHQKALEVLGRLEAYGPAARQAALFDSLDILKTMRSRQRMRATLETLVRLTWTQPEALRRCAKWQIDLDDPEAAIEIWDRVLQLEPEDSVTARKAAALLLELDRDVQARVQLIRAWRFADPKAKPKIAEELSAAWGKDAETEVRAMAGRALANPYDRGLALLASQLALRSELPDVAGELSDVHLARRPRDGEFLGVRARVQLVSGDVDGAMATAHLLVEYGAPRDDLVLDLVPHAMKAGNLDGVRGLGPLAENPVEIAEKLEKQGFPLRSVGILRGATEAGRPLDEGAARLLAKLHRYVEPPELAMRAFEAVEELDGPSVVTTHRLGLLYARAGDAARALVCALRLESLGAAEPMVESFVRSAKLEEAWEARD